MTSPLRELAHQLITVASRTDADAVGILRVVKGLDTVLTRLAGRTGSRSLIARAASLAQAEAPSLKTVDISADGVLEVLEELVSMSVPQEQERVEGIVVTHLLGLLITFIGERLTWQLIKEAWPDHETQHEDIRKAPRS